MTRIMSECMCKKKYVPKKSNLRVQDVRFCGSAAVRTVLAPPLAAGRRLRLLLPLVALLPRLLVLTIVPRNVAADPAALRLATGYGLPPIPDGGPLVLGLPTVKSQLDRRRLSVAGIVVGEDSPHVGAQLDAAASRYLGPGQIRASQGRGSSDSNDIERILRGCSLIEPGLDYI